MALHGQRFDQSATPVIANVKKRLRGPFEHLLQAGVARGLPPSWFGYRWVRRTTVSEYFGRSGRSVDRYEVVHPGEVFQNPLPCNVSRREELPDDRGWWGYSFRDVPARTSDETWIATIPDARVVWYNDPQRNGDFFPAILTCDGRALDLREVRFRPPHADALRHSGPPVRIKKATWVLERVYHNHSHWLTAHLPRLLLLRQRGGLGEVLLPPKPMRTPTIDSSLHMIGLDPDRFRTFDPARSLKVGELTLLGTDRFRPQLLRQVPQAFGTYDAPPPHRKVYISRAKAKRRRLLNEDAVWALLEPAGFERVIMEERSFEEQVELMQATAVLFAPHGAGLTNMVFCPPGASIVEMADLSFPNPNFYALASALGHRYWLVKAESVGDAHPLEKDLRADLAAVAEVLLRLGAERAE